jgi:hypothetical protein
VDQNVLGAKLEKNLKLMTVLLFIYNSLLGFTIAILTKSSARIVLLLLIALDYFILFYYFTHVSDKLERGRIIRKENKNRKMGRKPKVR